jgi:hypothetical protein
MMMVMVMVMMMMMMISYLDPGTLSLAQYLCVWKYKVDPLEDEAPLHPDTAKVKETGFQNPAASRTEVHRVHHCIFQTL